MRPKSDPWECDRVPRTCAHVPIRHATLQNRRTNTERRTRAPPPMPRFGVVRTKRSKPTLRSTTHPRERSTTNRSFETRTMLGHPKFRTGTAEASTPYDSFRRRLSTRRESNPDSYPANVPRRWVRVACPTRRRDFAIARETGSCS